MPGGGPPIIPGGGMPGRGGGGRIIGAAETCAMGCGYQINLCHSDDAAFKSPSPGA